MDSCKWERASLVNCPYIGKHMDMHNLSVNGFVLKEEFIVS